MYMGISPMKTGGNTFKLRFIMYEEETFYEGWCFLVSVLVTTWLAKQRWFGTFWEDLFYL